MPTDPTSIPAEAVEAVVAAAVAGATQSTREMTGNPTLIPSPIGLESIRQEVTAALLAVTPILLAAGRTAAADIEVLDAANRWRNRYGTTGPEFHVACESLAAAVDARRAARIAEDGADHA